MSLNNFLDRNGLNYLWSKVVSRISSSESSITSKIPIASDDLPKDLGPSSPGVSSKFSRSDHVHKVPDDIVSYTDAQTGVEETTKINALIDRKTGKTIYPQTIARAIYDSYGKDLQTRLDELNQNYIATSPQTLTNEQKTQARENIDAASTNELNAIPKPNLFINPLFQIWQLYPSGWSGVPVNRYVCDGWRVLSSNGAKTNNLIPAAPYGMTNVAGGPNCSISRFLENAAQFNGLQMTCSVLKITIDGSQSFITATKTASGWTDSTDILAFFGTSSKWRWINSGETLIGAKLEVGTQQTFVHKQANGTYVLNSVPTVAEQLAICNKYDPETGKLLGGWDHPPMLLGVEYRTTERYLGKPVYALLKQMGACSAGEFITSNAGLASVAKIVSVSGFTEGASTGGSIALPHLYGIPGTSDFTRYSISLSAQLSSSGNGDVVIGIGCGEARSFSSADVLLKYTKTTD